MVKKGECWWKGDSVSVFWWTEYCQREGRNTTALTDFCTIFFPMSRSDEAGYGHWGEHPVTGWWKLKNCCFLSSKRLYSFPSPFFQKGKMYLFCIFDWIKTEDIDSFHKLLFFSCLISTFCLQINDWLLEMHWSCNCLWQRTLSMPACALPPPVKRPFSERPCQRCCSLIKAVSLYMSYPPLTLTFLFQPSLKIEVTFSLVEDSCFLTKTHEKCLIFLSLVQFGWAGRSKQPSHSTAHVWLGGRSCLLFSSFKPVVFFPKPHSQTSWTGNLGILLATLVKSFSLEHSKFCAYNWFKGFYKDVRNTLIRKKYLLKSLEEVFLLFFHHKAETKMWRAGGEGMKRTSLVIVWFQLIHRKTLLALKAPGWSFSVITLLLDTFFFSYQSPVLHESF